MHFVIKHLHNLIYSINACQYSSQNSKFTYEHVGIKVFMLYGIDTDVDSNGRQE